MRLLHGHLRNLFVRYRTARLTDHLVQVAINVLFSLGLAGGLALGAWLYRRDDITLGTVYMISYYVGLLIWPLQQLSSQIQDLQQARASITRVAELSAAQPTITDGPGAPISDGALGVGFAHVSFSYVAGHPVLEDITFALEPGKLLGLLGRTGSGKTTLTRLLVRLYDPDTGTIRLGGSDARQMRLADIRQRVGVVTQDVQLFRATVRDNLSFFDARISDERMRAALHELGLTAWFQSLPHGLDTLLAAGGEGLSAGEAQLLAFTRVLLRDPGLIILDEASSRLDPATERQLERAIDRLMAGRTGIVIAHKLQTVGRVDEIMILENGRIVEHGPRALLARDEHTRFAQLLRTGLEEVLT